jgi:hypothetical protein
MNCLRGLQPDGHWEPAPYNYSGQKVAVGLAGGIMGLQFVSVRPILA